MARRRKTAELNLTTDEIEMIRRIAKRTPKEDGRDLCPKCGRRKVDARTAEGWCRTCARQRRTTDSERAAESSRDRALLRLELLARERARIEDEIEETVREARIGDASWQQIAEALGVTKQSVHRRYGGIENERW